MPRPPNPNSKIPQIIFRARNPDQASKINWLKRWCAMNGKTLHEVMYPRVEEMCMIHGFPEGHSQTSLDFVNEPGLLPRYKTCLHSRKQLDRGEFYCNYGVSAWKIPVACTRCDRYQAEADTQ